MLARGVLKTWDLIQVVVIELLTERLPDVVDDVVVDEPARFRVHGSCDRELDLEGMAMQSLALVPRRHVRQAMGGFEAELLDKAYVHEGTTLSQPAQRTELAQSDGFG